MAVLTKKINRKQSSSCLPYVPSPGKFSVAAEWQITFSFHPLKNHHPTLKISNTQITITQSNCKCLKKKGEEMPMSAQKREYYFCLYELVQGFTLMLGFKQRTGFQQAMEDILC